MRFGSRAYAHVRKKKNCSQNEKKEWPAIFCEEENGSFDRCFAANLSFINGKTKKDAHESVNALSSSDCMEARLD